LGYTDDMEIKDVEVLAELARIELSEDEKKEILADMESILGYVKQVEEAEVENVAIKNDLYNVWREDTIKPREFDDRLIKDQFPDSEDGFLKVKKIL